MSFLDEARKRSSSKGSTGGSYLSSVRSRLGVDSESSIANTMQQIEAGKRQEKIDNFNRARAFAQQSEQDSIKATQKLDFWQGLIDIPKAAAKSVFGAAKEFGENKRQEIGKSIQERGFEETKSEIGKGMIKNVGELASGTAKLAVGLTPLTGYSTIRKVTSFVGGKQVEEYLDRNTPEYQKKIGAWVDNNAILNYHPDYENEMQKTGGEVAEIGSWFIPITRAGKAAKIGELLKDLPKVAKILGVTPKLVKVGSKFAFEVSKDVVDVAVLDAIRGKDWETVLTDAKYAAVGGGAIRGVTGGIAGVLKMGRTNRLVNTVEQGIGKLDDEERAIATKLIDENRTADDIAEEIMDARQSAGREVIGEPVEDLVVKFEKEAAAETKVAEKVEVPTQKVEAKAGVEKPKEVAVKETPAVKEPVVPQTIPTKKTESPVLKRLNENLDEAHKVDPNLEVTTHKEQLAKAEQKILENPEKAYNDAVFGGKEKMSDPLRTSTLAALLENAKIKGDQKAIAEIGTSIARHGRKAGQEVEMIKAMIQDNPTNKALVDLANAKLQSVASRFKKLKAVAKEGEDISEAAVRVVKSKAKQILKKEIKFKVSRAQNLIKSLTC